MMKTTTLIGLCIILVLLSGCGAALNGAASSTPTIVPLPSLAQTPTTPTPLPTASPLPLPSATPLPARPTPTPVSPTPTATVITPPVAGQPGGSSLEETTSVAGGLLSGEWNFTFGAMVLTQQEARVEGTYQWYGGADTGRVEGIVIDDLNQFQGMWISDRNPTSQSLLRWRLAADRSSFSGSFGGSRTGQWCGVRSGQSLPPGCGFSGVWQLHFGSPPGVTGQATLVQVGQGVITVQSIAEAKLAGTWRNDQGQQDSFEWRLDLTTGRTFQGRRNPGNSEWCGWREGTSEPEQCGWED
jgi:hypothetical protein